MSRVDAPAFRPPSDCERSVPLALLLWAGLALVAVSAVGATASAQPLVASADALDRGRAVIGTGGLIDREAGLYLDHAGLDAAAAPRSPRNAFSRDLAPRDLARIEGGLADARGSAAPPQRTGYSLQEITDPIPLHSSINRQLTYQESSSRGGKGFVKLKAVLAVEAGLPMLSRIEWPIPEVDSESGPTTVGVGDLTWLNLLVLWASPRSGTVGLGPVAVFPTASRPEMGQGKTRSAPRSGT
jgi:hypothetical protein